MGASRKSGKRSGMLQKMGVLALAAALVLPPAACGDSSRDVGQAEEWLWVPEYISLDETEEAYHSMQLAERWTDENGEPVVSVGGAVGGFAYADGWSYDYRRPTREEVDLVMDLIQIAKPPSYARGDEVLKIIREEAEAFYRGQKTVDEVASIIQNRAKIFVGENKQH